jgi:hypothetical protein
MRSSSTITALISAAGAAASSIAAQPHSGQHLGEVHFQTSCNSSAQAHFDRGMRYQHSFWYRESKASFEEALRADPNAQSPIGASRRASWPTRSIPPRPRTCSKGERLFRRVFHTDFETLNQRTRALGDAPAMEAVASRYPNDDEVRPITRLPST